MEYIINNDSLNEKEIEYIKKEANSKLISILSALVDSSSHTFFGELRLNNFTSNIISINDQIAEVENSLHGLDLKSYDELKKIAKEYKIKGYSRLNKDLLSYEVEKAIYAKLEFLRDKSATLSNDYTRNYKNTFEYFINDKISKLESALTLEHNLDLINYYRFLLENFKILNINLKSIHSSLDAVSYAITLLNDYEEELTDVKNSIKENQRLLAISTDYNEMVNLREAIAKDFERKKSLIDLIEAQKTGIINIVDSKNLTTDFAIMKLDIFECLVNIKSNISVAYNNNAIDVNEEDMDKCMKAFGEFFTYPIFKQQEFENYLDDKEATYNNEKQLVAGPRPKSYFFNNTLTVADTIDKEENKENVLDAKTEDFVEDVNKSKTEEPIENLEGIKKEESEESLKDEKADEPIINEGANDKDPLIKDEPTTLDSSMEQGDDKPKSNLENLFRIEEGKRNKLGVVSIEDDESVYGESIKNNSDKGIDINALSFKEKMIYLCNLMGDKLVLKVVSTKDTIVDKFTSAKNKSKASIGKNNIFVIAKQKINNAVEDTIYRIESKEEGRTK